MTTVNTHTYTRSHTAVYVSDKLRNFLKILVRDYGLDPQGVVDAWSGCVDNAVRTWLESEHLKSIIIEFYYSGRDNLLERWDFPIQYDGNGDADMWIDRRLFQNSLCKAKAPPTNCTYRIVLSTYPGRPDIPGISPAKLRSTAGLVNRGFGTIIGTQDIMVSASYYR